MEAVHDVQSTNEQMQDLMNRCNRDILNVRAATNTLRSHSEETRSIVDDCKRITQRARDELDGNDARIKKLVAFVQGETGDLATQLRDLQGMIDRADDRIETFSRVLAQLSAQQQKQQARPAVEAIPVDQKPKSPVVSTPTSPHIPTPTVDVVVTDPFGPKAKEEREAEPTTTVIQLPEKIVYEQPIVTIVRKQRVEVVETTAMHGKGLPRIGASQSRREQEVSRSDLKPFENLIPRVKDIDGAVAGMKLQLEQMLKQLRTLTELKAERSELQTLFEQFRNALGELSNRIVTIRRTLLSKAEACDLQDVQQRLLRQNEEGKEGETAAGAESIRCLLCGKPRTAVRGAIDDPELVRALGPGTSTRVTSAGGHGSACFVYGDHGALFWGRSPDGRSILSRGTKEKEALPGLAPAHRSTSPPQVPVKVTNPNL
jgi:hypothetical protein